MNIAVLGPVRVDGRDLTGRMQTTLLSVLTARARKAVPVSELCRLLWPGGDEPRNDQRLQLHVHRLRRVLGCAERLVRVGDAYQLRVPPEEIDADLFDALLGRAETPGTPAREVVRLADEALALWRGTPFGGLDLPALSDSVARLTERRHQAAEVKYAAELRLGRHAAVVAGLRDLVTRNPLRERPAELLMTALHESGRQAEALDVYHEIRCQLVNELGIEPGSGLRNLQALILAGGTPRADRRAPAAAPARRFPRPAQLPHDAGRFVGRSRELTELDDVAPGSVVVISGTAGVGKTTLSVHWAHRAAGRFPDGQLYADLRGYGPDEARDPHTVLTGFLHAFGVPARDVPADPDERVALYRSLLAGRRVLVVVDNANGPDQVRPLLPGGTSGLAVVTSRDALTGLVVREGALRLHLGRMPAGEAAELFRSAAGPVALTDPAAVDAIVDRCARLPLALRVAAEQLASRPGTSVGAQLAQLDGTSRLDALDVDDERTAVRSVLSWSYARLQPDAARLFRLYGLHPGPDLSTTALAATAGLGLGAARRAVDSLARSGVVEQDADDRIQPHDLMREFARERATAEEPPSERAAARRRLYEWYLHTAVAARLGLDARAAPIAVDGPAPPLVGTFTERFAAMRWFEAERPNLVALIRQAAGCEPRLAWQLAGSLLTYFYLTKHWDDWLATHHAGLGAARSLGDDAGCARMLNGLGVAYGNLDRLDDSVTAHEEAAALYDESADTLAAAWNLNNLGVTYENAGRLAAAADRYRRARRLFTTAGDLRGQALVLHNIGDLNLKSGDWESASGMLSEALNIQLRSGDLEGRRFTLRALGDLARDSGRLTEARPCYLASLSICRETGDRVRTAEALRRLADVERALGNQDSADLREREAAVVFQELDAAADAVVAGAG